MATLNNLVAWCKTLPLPWRRWRIIGHVDSGDEVPDKLPHRGVVLVGTAQPAWVALDCPCGTGHRLLVNLDSGRHPRWELDSKPRLSLWPSIDVRAHNRRCHFVLNEGKVRWIPVGREPAQGRRRRRPVASAERLHSSTDSMREIVMADDTRSDDAHPRDMYL